MLPRGELSFPERTGSLLTRGLDWVACREEACLCFSGVGELSDSLDTELEVEYFFSLVLTSSPLACLFSTGGGERDKEDRDSSLFLVL